MESVIVGFSVSAALFERFEDCVNGRNTGQPCKGRKGTPHAKVIVHVAPPASPSPDSTSSVSEFTHQNVVTSEPGETPMVRRTKWRALKQRRIDFDLPEDEGTEG